MTYLLEIYIIIFSLFNKLAVIIVIERVGATLDKVVVEVLVTLLEMLLFSYEVRIGLGCLYWLDNLGGKT